MRHKLTSTFFSIVFAAILSLQPITTTCAAPYPAPLQPEAPTGELHDLTIPAAAFHPSSANHSYQIYGRYLIHYGLYIIDQVYPYAGEYVAPVQLPDGASIKGVTYFYKDPGAGSSHVYLNRYSVWSDTVDTIVDLQSFDTISPGFGFTNEDSNQAYNPIQNGTYNYFLKLTVDGGGAVWPCAVRIEYTTNPPPSYGFGALFFPPAAFTPYTDGSGYVNGGSTLKNYFGPPSLAGRGWYYAPVYLPDGVTVTSFHMVWKRNQTTSEIATARLQRSTLYLGNYKELAAVDSNGGIGSEFATTGDTTIVNPLISNATYAYWVVVDLPNGSPPLIELRGIEIHYSLPTSSANILAVSAPAFQPSIETYTFQNAGRWLVHHNGPGIIATNGWYYAPVNLPNGVQISHIGFFWFENTALAGYVRLQRTTLGYGDYQDMAVAYTTTGSNSGNMSADLTVDYAVIDNQHYAYWLVFFLPADANPSNIVKAYSVKIYYKNLIYLPVIRR